MSDETAVIERGPTPNVGTPEPDAVQPPQTVENGRFDLARVEDPTKGLRKAKELVSYMADQCTGPEYIAEIEGKQFPRVDWWTSVGGGLGLFPQEESVEREERDGDVIYRATVGVYDGNQRVTRASAICSSAESNWSGRDENDIRSMAITRATGKAYRIGLSFLPVMAGLEPTPAEEMRASGSSSSSPETPFDCPECGSDTWDNTDDPKAALNEGEGNRPSYKCRDSDCDWATWPSGDELMDEVGEALSELTGWDSAEGNRLSTKASENQDKLRASKHHAEQFLAAVNRRIEAAKDAVEEGAREEQGDLMEGAGDE